jgi:hypothetical protein
MNSVRLVDESWLRASDFNRGNQEKFSLLETLTSDMGYSDFLFLTSDSF